MQPELVQARGRRSHLKMPVTPANRHTSLARSKRGNPDGPRLRPQPPTRFPPRNISAWPRKSRSKSPKRRVNGESKSDAGAASPAASQRTSKSVKYLSPPPKHSGEKGKRAKLAPASDLSLRPCSPTGRVSAAWAPVQEVSPAPPVLRRPRGRPPKLKPKTQQLSESSDENVSSDWAEHLAEAKPFLGTGLAC